MNHYLLPFLIFAMVGATAAPHPYAPNQVTGLPNGDFTLSYNTMGQRLDNKQGQTIQWGLVNKPTTISTDQSVESLAHGPGGRTYLRKDNDGNTILYVGEFEYHIHTSQSALSRYYIRSHGYSPVAMVEKRDNDVSYSSFLRDHLGSALLTIDDEGAVSANSHGRHDPWGQPGNSDGTAAELNESSRAFTGHENIASAQLINMNARIQDPLMGQFLGPDPLIQGAGHLPALNRYCYMANSPLQGTDPTGNARTTIGPLGELSELKAGTFAARGDSPARAIPDPNNPRAGIVLSKKSQRFYDKMVKAGLSPEAKYNFAEKVMLHSRQKFLELPLEEQNKLAAMHVASSNIAEGGSNLISFSLNEAAAAQFGAVSGPDGVVLSAVLSNDTAYPVGTYVRGFFHGNEVKATDIDRLFVHKNATLPVGEILVPGGAYFYDTIPFDLAARQHPSTYRNITDVMEYLSSQLLPATDPRTATYMRQNFVGGFPELMQNHFGVNITALEDLTFFPNRELN